jgi:diacylglycerol O-acyltransferase / wax synthase
VWIDDPDFDVNRHVLQMPCRASGDEPALLETALSVIMTPLPRWAPLWSLVLITELAEGAAAVVVVLHHALADGLGGLNLLAALVDPGATSDVLFPRPTPTRRSCA